MLFRSQISVPSTMELKAVTRRISYAVLPLCPHYNDPKDEKPRPYTGEAASWEFDFDRRYTFVDIDGNPRALKFYEKANGGSFCSLWSVVFMPGTDKFKFDKCIDEKYTPSDVEYLASVPIWMYDVNTSDEQLQYSRTLPEVKNGLDLLAIAMQLCDNVVSTGEHMRESGMMSKSFNFSNAYNEAMRSIAEDVDMPSILAQGKKKKEVKELVPSHPVVEVAPPLSDNDPSETEFESVVSDLQEQPGERERLPFKARQFVMKEKKLSDGRVVRVAEYYRWMAS